MLRQIELAQPYPNGAMIAFYLPPEAAQQMAMPGGVPIPELHLTMLYLGSDENIPDLEGLKRAFAEWAKWQLPMVASTNGLAVFNKKQEDGTKPLVALIDSPYLDRMRYSLCDLAEYQAKIEYPREHSFTPHVTLAYMTPDYLVAGNPSLFPLSDLAFNLDTISLVVGSQRWDVELTGEPVQVRVDEQGFFYSVKGENLIARKKITMPQYARAFSNIDGRAGDLAANTALPIPFIASTEGLKRDGKDLKAADWRLERFNDKYPVILFGHDYWRNEFAHRSGQSPR